MGKKETSIDTAWERKVTGFILGFTGLATTLFWILFFSGRIQATETEQDESFERAFPLADSWMSASCMLAAWHLWRGDAEGEFFGVAAGSSLLFLSLLDILYSLENRKYWPLDKDRSTMLVIHLWTFGLGAATLANLWRNWRSAS
ncbi:MAG: hypothetical protein SWK76_11105 [Actinomycetota bacterium]|nr:hypothetical protein [Actinomycetota bacterium]